jgi:membrane associated rhomboid family serine protease
MFPLKDSERTTKIPFITWLIIVINVFAFLYQLAQPDIDAFIYEYGLIPGFIDWSNSNTWWPFVTSMFMHGGFMHIISNMWYFAVFGDNVEDKLGTIKYVIFYLAAGFVASYTQYLVSPDSFIPMIGASGAIAGVLGFYLVAFPHATVKTLIVWFYRVAVTEVSAVLLLGFWGLTQLFNSVGSITALESGGTAWFAHLGGFVFGMAIAFIVKGGDKGLIDRN